jgi:hypothetical protein
MNTKDIPDKLLALQLQWIAAADGKVTPVFAIDTAMLGVLAALAPPPAEWTIGAGITTSLAIAALVSSVVCLAQATFPRLEGPGGSLLFFGDIASITRSDYLNRMLACKEDELIKDIYVQIHRNAEIAKDKFYFIWWAMVFSFCGLPFWIIAVWLLY